MPRISIVSLAAVVVVAILSPLPAPAQDSPAARACNAGDLGGAWSLQGMHIAKTETVERTNPSFFEYQRFVFMPNGTVKHLATNKPLTDKDHAALKAMPASSTWTVDERGWLTIRKTGAPEPEKALCALMLRNHEPAGGPAAPRAGDVLLSYMRGERPVVQKLLRKSR